MSLWTDALDSDHLADSLHTFLFEKCHVEPTWTPERFIVDQVAAIKHTVKNEGRVVCGLSGGVDSSVAAALVYRAVGDRLVTIFVDHGLLRHGEADEVIEAFSSRFGSNFIHVDVSER